MALTVLNQAYNIQANNYLTGGLIITWPSNTLNYTLCYDKNMSGLFVNGIGGGILTGTMPELSADYVTNMAWAFNNCRTLVGQPICGPAVINMYNAYTNCYRLTGSPVCSKVVTDMRRTYYECRNIVGSPVCGPKVTNLFMTYANCTNLTGSPVCGPVVTNMYWTYWNCTNLTGRPTCGPLVASISYAYYNCQNLIGSPVCGANVVDMSGTYSNCWNLSGNPVFGPLVDNIYQAYRNCVNLTGDSYLNTQIAVSSNIRGCFNNCKKPITLYVKNQDTFNLIHDTTDAYSIVGEAIAWTTINTNAFKNTGLYNLTVIYKP